MGMIDFDKIENRKRIGRKIALLRKERELTALELAELTGLKRENLTRIELGKYSTGIDILGKIAEALGCTLDFISQND